MFFLIKANIFLLYGKRANWILLYSESCYVNGFSTVYADIGFHLGDRTVWAGLASVASQQRIMPSEYDGINTIQTSKKVEELPHILPVQRLLAASLRHCCNVLVVFWA